jgi:hypothetical protein
MVGQLEADYAPGADWAQGFAIIFEDEAAGTYSAELVQVINGVATVGALGKTVRAA